MRIPFTKTIFLLCAVVCGAQEITWEAGDSLRGFLRKTEKSDGSVPEATGRPVSSAQQPDAARPFFMGTTPFFYTPAAFPDWRFENLEDKDILSLHIDDFLGIPWKNFRDGTPPPPAWAARLEQLRNSAAASGKVLYLAASPLGERKTLAPDVDPSGQKIDRWAPADASGCYPVSSDPDAQYYKIAYINYLRYLIELFHPQYLSPVIEMNVAFTKCPSQETAWIGWHTDVYHAVKNAYPQLVVFPTFQMEHMYGIAEPAAACAGGLPSADCFRQRLGFYAGIAGDRIAFSVYPSLWGFLGQSIADQDPFGAVSAVTQKKIWIAETGWGGVKILSQYAHGAQGCGADLVPASVNNDANIAGYMSWLLSEAQAKRFEAVIWWENRDYLDAAVAQTCPCAQPNDTCALADAWYNALGNTGEFLLRSFGNMGLRHYDGTPRLAHQIWDSYLRIAHERTDAVAPVVSVAFPKDNSTVSRIVAIAVLASDNVRIEEVRLALDGRFLAALAAEPYHYFWDTRAVADGGHSLTATARDQAGNIASVSISVLVDNTPPAITKIAAAFLPPRGTAFGRVASISWTTDEPADAQVLLGTDPSRGAMKALPLKSRLELGHLVRVRSLRTDTPYYFFVISRDAHGNRAEQGPFVLYMPGELVSPGKKLNSL